MDGFTFESEPLRETTSKFSLCLNGGEMTLLVVAPSRHGKSTVATSIHRKLVAKGEMVVFWANLALDRKERDAPDQLWLDLLRPVNPTFTVSVSRPYESFFNLAVAEADRMGTDFIVIIIDEAQNLTVDKLANLKKLCDDLRGRKLSPFVLQFAQPSVLARPDRLKRQNYHDLVDRFDQPRHRLRGMKLSELKKVLEYYDSEQWPAGSGTSYTAHFLSGPWTRGWRLSKQEEVVIAGFLKLANDIGWDPNDIGMKFVVGALRIFLTTAQASNKTDDDALKGFLEAAIRRCGLEETYRTVGDAEAAARLHGLGRGRTAEK